MAFLLKPYIAGNLLPSRCSALDAVVAGMEQQMEGAFCDGIVSKHAEASHFTRGMCGYAAKLLSSLDGLGYDYLGLDEIKYTGFKHLLETCWQNGVQVLLLRAYPKSFPSLKWCIVKHPRPFIFLGSSYPQQGRQGYYLAQALARLTLPESPIGDLDTTVEDMAQEWVDHFLFGKPMEAPDSPGSPELLIDWAESKFRGREGEAITAVTDMWGAKYLALGQTALNRLEQNTDVEGVGEALYYDHIYRFTTKVSLPVQFFLAQLFAPGNNQYTKKEREFNLLQERADNLSKEGCSEEQVYAVKEVFGLLKYLPHHVTYRDGVVSIILGTGKKLDLSDSRTFNFFWDAQAPFVSGDIGLLPDCVKDHPAKVWFN